MFFLHGNIFLYTKPNVIDIVKRIEFILVMPNDEIRSQDGGKENYIKCERI